MKNRAKTVAVSTVGYMCLAITIWMMSMSNAGWYGPHYSIAILYALALVLGVIGILAFVDSLGLDATVFFGATAMIGAAATYILEAGFSPVKEPLSYIGWFTGLFSLYFLYLCLASVRSGATRTLFLGFLSLSLILLAIGSWTGATGWYMAGGYSGLVSAIFAFVTSGSEILTLGRNANPNLEVPATTARPIAAD